MHATFERGDGIGHLAIVEESVVVNAPCALVVREVAPKTGRRRRCPTASRPRWEQGCPGHPPPSPSQVVETPSAVADPGVASGVKVVPTGHPD